MPIILGVKTILDKGRFISYHPRGVYFHFNDFHKGLREKLSEKENGKEKGKRESGRENVRHGEERKKWKRKGEKAEETKKGGGSQN